MRSKSFIQQSLRQPILYCLLFIFHITLLTLPVQAQYKVVHMDKPYNTVGSETGALRVGDTVLVYASMPPDSGRERAFGFNQPVMQLLQARISRDGKIARPRPNRWGLNSKKDHTGNIALDPLTNDLYFTRGDLETLRCDIWYAKKQKRGWQKPVRLRGPVNDRQYTATHPTIGRLADNTVLLYFVSDRPGGMGGMDIWYSIVKDGVAGEPVNLGPQVNSASDEYTPFYDQRNGILYFSSDRQMMSETSGGDRHSNGGFDIYCAIGSRNTWQKAEPVCGCLNSEQNDLYFRITDYDTLSGFPIGGYLSSNRSDSFFMNDSMCCNDIYRWVVDSGQLVAVETPVPDTLPTTKPQLSNIHFPLFLYFHNDEPDPRSRDSVTTASYSDCQRHYATLRNEYIAHQSTARDSAEMTLFFDSCVVGNYEHVQELFDYIEAILDEGKKVELTISGYASDVFTDEYNRILSARRINSFINMIRAWRGGLFADAIDDGRLLLVQNAHGIAHLSTHTTRLSSNTDPVFSLAAAMARHIEILSCKIK